MIAAILLADLTQVVAVSTFEMLIFYLIANIAAFRIPIKYWQYPALVPIIDAVSCIVLLVFSQSIHGLALSDWEEELPGMWCNDG
jgi:hypothetical protein